MKVISMASSKLRTVFVLIVLGALAGCAGVKPSSLKAATTTRAIELHQPYVYERFFTISANRFRYSLAAGPYLPLYEDSNGTYFRGPPGCFKEELVETGLGPDSPLLHKPEASECGIYIASGGDTPKIFIYIGSSRRVAPAGLDEGVAASIGAQAAPTASPVQAGVGTGLAVGLIGAMVEAEKGNVAMVARQPLDDSLRAAIRFK